MCHNSQSVSFIQCSSGNPAAVRRPQSMGTAARAGERILHDAVTCWAPGLREKSSRNGSYLARNHLGMHLPSPGIPAALARQLPRRHRSLAAAADKCPTVGALSAFAVAASAGA